VRATAFTLAAIAVVNRDVTQFVFAIDDDPLGKLNALIGASGHPIGLVGARIGGGIVDTTPNRLPSIRTTPTRWPICRPSASPS
jgi:hypothetical protein